MLIALSVLYPLCRKNYQLFTDLIAPVIGIMFCGILISQFGNLGTLHTHKLFYIYASNYRAASDIALGAFCFGLIRKINDRNWNRRVLISIELLCFIAITFLAVEFKGRNACGLLVLLIFIMVMIEYSRYGLSDNVPKKTGAVFTYLGRISLPMYLVQSVFRKIRPYVFDSFRYRTQIIVLFICIVLSAMLLDIIFNRFSALYKNKRVTNENV